VVINLVTHTICDIFIHIYVKNKTLKYMVKDVYQKKIIKEIKTFEEIVRQ